MSSEILKWGLIIFTLVICLIIYTVSSKIMDALKFSFNDQSEEIDEYSMYKDGVDCDLEGEGINIMEKMETLRKILETKYSKQNK